VVLHGIGPGGGEALDSARTSGSGEYRIRYARSVDGTVQYFVSTVHHGIAYVSGAMPPAASPDDATLTVFDTTSAPVPLEARGRHIIVFARSEGPRHRVAEIYDLTNDTIVTRVVQPGGPPVWTAVLPAGAQDFSSGPEIGSNEVIRIVDGRVAAFAPVAPGLKRIAFTYALPPEAFPVSFPVEEPTEIVEVLVEDEGADVSGAGLAEVTPTNIEGRMFRRFQAQGVPALAVITVSVPFVPPPPGAATPVLVAVVAMVMIVALVVGLRRSRATAPAHASTSPVSPESEVDSLARRIAELDAAFELAPSHTADEQLRYRQQREVLKRQLSERLAGSANR
jgi:hypothetical protein